MRLILIRHAAPVRTEAVASGADPELAEIGQRQALRLAEALAREPIVDIVSSPSRRALETATPLADALGHTIRTEPGLAEYDYGMPDYIPMHELKAADPDAYRRMGEGLLPPYVDETAFRARVTDALDKVVANASGSQAVAVVTHGGAINVYLTGLLGARRPLAFAVAYTSVSRVLASRSGMRTIESVNETAHVAELLADL